MADNIAGSVTIEIGGSLAPFEAALAKGRQIAATFDAQISSKLSGGVSAGLARIADGVDKTNELLARMTGATKATASALSNVADEATRASTALKTIDTTTTAATTSATRLNAALATNLATTKAGFAGQAGVIKGVAEETENLGTAGRLGATQMASLGHSARSAIESLALGVPVTQALTAQANHLSYAFSGPQGVIAATAASRAAFAGWLTSVPGLLTGAGVAAVAGVAAYIVATRNSILSVDEVLSKHKTLIDEISAGWPEAAKAAASYAEAAMRIPQSVATADLVEGAKENKRTLDDIMGSLSTRTKMLSEEWGLVGSAGTKAFGDLAQIANSGAADAADRIESALGRMRIDPTLNENAHQFAKELQDDATAAAKLQDALNEKHDVADIIGNNKRASQTLFEIAGGLDKVKASAGGADAVIAKLFGTIDAGSSGGFGVTRSLNAQVSGIFEDVNRAVQKSRQDQLGSMVDLQGQLRATTSEADNLRQALATTGSKQNLLQAFGDTSSIRDASAEIERATSAAQKLFDAMATGNTSVQNVFSGLDMIRQTLIRDGFGVDAVNAFVDSLVRTRTQLDSDIAGAKQMNAAIQGIRDKVVTITIQTRQLGSGTQSIYDVPSTSGGSGGVGVTRYGAVPGTQSGPSMSAYSVPSSYSGAESAGYGSSYGGGGSSTVGVTRFRSSNTITVQPVWNQQTQSWGYPARAAGGPMSAGMPYLVGERGPELVVPSASATVIPNAQTMALASAQSAFTGMQPTKESDRVWTVLMNVEANTRKTAQLLDDIKITSAISSSGLSSSYGGGSSSSGGTIGDSQTAAYMAALATARSNYAMIGGKQPIGYGLDGLAASPEQIAHRAVYGFDTGGMIGGGPGDTQKVEFFKSPEEKVIIARPDQFTDARSAANSNTSGGDRPINVAITQTHNWNGNAPPSRDSVAEMRRQTALAVQDAMRAVRGR
ncbi:hypothetical protein [Mesorhizobium sp. B1-1-9]|uniref:hypothetical protein n=1 Tax=Mesorhizobium sp. B1-1-9 TaxID=2589975 RepID=UPI001AED1BA8|nr:hypothetical protein [Mesorhizobium sp. B1-1-9]